MKDLFIKPLLILIFSGVSIVSTAQCSMKGEYADLFQVTTYSSEESGTILIQRIAKIGSDKCYSAAVNNMPFFFDYIKTNFSDREVYKEIDLESDSIDIEGAFRLAVSKDVLMQSKLDEYMMKINGQMPKDTLLLSELQDIAVKFFNIKGITEEGYYVGKVCVGINLIEETIENRKPYAEAMAFSTIMADLKFQHSSLLTNFKNHMKSLYDLNLGLNEEDRLLRAQGAMMLMMKNDAQLSGMLAYAYAKNQKYLPFVLK